MQIVTGYTGAPHVTSEQDRILNRAIFGSESIILNIGNHLDIDIISNNELQIKDGAVLQQGCLGVIPVNTSDIIQLKNGTQGMKRTDLIVCRYEQNNQTLVENLSIEVIDGTPSQSESIAPEYTSGNIANGDTIDEFPLYTVKLDGLNIVEVTKLARICPNLANAVFYEE